MQGMTTDSIRIGAVLLCGGAVPPSLAGHCRHRALLRVQGRLLLALLLDTLRKSARVFDSVVVAPAEALAELEELTARTAPSGGKLVETMQAGVAVLAPMQPTHILFITGDIPLVTVEGLDGYLHASLASGAALSYPIIPKASCEQRFPGTRRTYVKIHEGVFTGGNAILCSQQHLPQVYALVEDLYAARKNPLKLAHILGWPTVLRMLTGQLTLPYLEAVASRLLAAPVRAIITESAEIGFDIDKAEDLTAVERALASCG